MRNVYVHVRTFELRYCSNTTPSQKQPPTMPRPDLKALGVNYRRIPVMTIGRDIYCDTRIMLRKLEEFFPNSPLRASTAEQKAIEKFLEMWTIEAGLFVRAAQLIPPTMPLLNDPKFTKDREDFSGSSWDKEQIAANRPEALAAVRNSFNLLETTILADGRQWVLKTNRPTLADIEGKQKVHCSRLYLLMQERKPSGPLIGSAA